jgi:hypothetical protein
MQTAPATSQKTPKVANDDFLSADETAFGPGERPQGRWQDGHQREHKPERRPPGDAGCPANSRQVTRTAHGTVITATGSGMSVVPCNVPLV